MTRLFGRPRFGITLRLGPIRIYIPLLPRR